MSHFPSAIIEAAVRALEEFRQAFIVAVGDTSPFAKQALLRADAALAALPLIEAAALERAAQVVDDRAASSASNAEFARDNGDREELILRFALKVADYKRLASDIRDLIPKDSGGGD